VYMATLFPFHTYDQMACTTLTLELKTTTHKTMIPIEPKRDLYPELLMRWPFSNRSGETLFLAQKLGITFVNEASLITYCGSGIALFRSRESLEIGSSIHQVAIALPSKHRVSLERIRYDTALNQGDEYERQPLRPTS